MPYADPEQRREYNNAYKRRQRAQAKTKKRFSKRQTASEIETVDDVHGLVAVVEEAISLVRNDRQSTGVTKGRALECCRLSKPQTLKLKIGIRSAENTR